MRANIKYMKLLVTMLAMVVVLPLSGYGANESNPEEITVSGTVKKQGITTYMYGTHVIIDDNAKKLYALRSSSIDLDKYVGRNVTVKGALVPGYPVDFGPDFLDVKSVTDY